MANEIKKRVDTIKSILGSMEDGEITVSAYDTAWVALIEDVHGSGAPQFPSSLEWIAKNQHPDGSWGFEKGLKMGNCTKKSLPMAPNSWVEDA